VSVEVPLTVVLIHRDEPVRLGGTLDAFLSSPSAAPTQGPAVAVRFTVVDNGSTPEHLLRLHEEVARRVAGGADVVVLEQGENTGFGPAANVGLRRWLAEGEQAEWVVVAPHDAHPLEGCLPTLLAVLAERPRAGLASADVGDGVTPVVDRYFGSIPAPATVEEGWEPAGYPHGTLMIARRACLEEVGLFDERYFAYCEEADLGERARRAGWEVGVVRGARVQNTHLSSATPAVDYLQLRNTLLLVHDRFGWYPGFIRFCTALLQLGQGVVRPSTRSDVFSAKARVLALGDHLRGRYGPPPPALFERRGAPEEVEAAT